MKFLIITVIVVTLIPFPASADQGFKSLFPENKRLLSQEKRQELRRQIKIFEEMPPEDLVHYILERKDPDNRTALMVLVNRKKRGDEAPYNLLKGKAENEDISSLMLMVRLAPRDKPEQALPWLKMAAEKGDPEAQMTLGNFYALGKGTEKNQTKAFEYYLKSAKQGNHFAQSFLGAYYGEGEVVKQDWIKHYAWQKNSYCGYDPIEFPVSEIDAQRLKPDELKKAMDLACEYYELYTEPFLSEKVKEANQISFESSRKARLEREKIKGKAKYGSYILYQKDD